MMTVDVDEASMDELMQQLLEGSPLARGLAPSPTMRPTPQGQPHEAEGQQCPTSASRSLFEGLQEPAGAGCGQDGAAEAAHEAALLRSGGKALARAQALRR